MKVVFILLASVVFLGLLGFFSLHADESDLIKADRQALAEAFRDGRSSKILAAKEQLSDDLAMEALEKRKDTEGHSIPLAPDGQGHFLVEVLINNKVHASLVIDTGSPVVVLNADFVKKLDLDVNELAPGYVELLNGRYRAGALSLNSVKIGDVEAHNIGTTVLIDENKDIKDGLLGLSFLSKFHFNLDQTGQKLILKKAD
ncbi:MAG: TIGR02281 family clan AA aspartic protease [Candidatus Omnitrophica bacterium]|nr:TIGR02281 family clan AA aspartic protease [Candidatus Omnitrophota bacterium]